MGWYAAKALTPEERDALGWPEEPAGVDTIRHAPEPRAGRYGWGEDAKEAFYASGSYVVETAEGGYFTAYVSTGAKADTAEEAAAKGAKLALKHTQASRKATALHDRWDRTVTAMAGRNRRLPRLREGWTMADHHRPLVGEHVIIWAHGGHRTAIVVETTKGRGVTVAYATPSSPFDVHLTKTTKYAVSTGPRPMSMGV